jgi:phage gp36-like protein
LEKYGLRSAAVSELTTDQKNAALLAASEFADGYLANANPFPITAWGTDLRRAVVQIAVWDIVSTRGINPDGSDELFERRAKAATDWLRDIAKGVVKPPALVPGDNLGVRTSSGNPDAPDAFSKRMSDDWGDFG